jgi:hypothetical protein
MTPPPNVSTTVPRVRIAVVQLAFLDSATAQVMLGVTYAEPVCQILPCSASSPS